MSAVNPSIALLELLERRVRRRNNAFRRRATLLVGAGLLLAVIVVTLAAPLLTSYDPNEIDPLHPLAAPLTIAPTCPVGKVRLRRSRLATRSTKPRLERGCTTSS